MNQSDGLDRCGGLCDLPTQPAGPVVFALDVTWVYGTKPERFTFSFNALDVDHEWRTPISLLFAALDEPRPSEAATSARKALHDLCDREGPGDTWVTLWCSLARPGGMAGKAGSYLFDGPGDQAWDELSHHWTLEERKVASP